MMDMAAIRHGLAVQIGTASSSKPIGDVGRRQSVSRNAPGICSHCSLSGCHLERGKKLQLKQDIQSKQNGLHRAGHVAHSRKLEHLEGKRRSSALACASRNARVAATATTDGKLELDVVEIAEPNSRVRLQVTVPPEIVLNVYAGVLKEFAKQAKVPGFRPGAKIPDAVLINFIGQSQVKASTVEAILKHTLPDAMSSVAGRALKESEHIVSKFENLIRVFSPMLPLSYEVAVDVAPEVRWASERAYANLQLEVDVDDEAAVADRAEAELRSRHQDLGSLRIATDPVLKVGDVAIIDMSAVRLDKDGNLGERIMSATQKGFQVDTGDRSNLLPDFVESLVGLGRGESKEFDIVFPQDWEQTFLRGVKARFTVECKELFTRELPELNDELAEKLIPGCTSIEQVRERLLLKYQEAAEKSNKQAIQQALVDELAAVCVMDVPNSLLEEQGRQMYSAKVLELQARGSVTKEQINQLSSPEMVNQFLVTQKERITKAVKQVLAVSEIYKLENLQFSKDELEQEVENAKIEFERFNQEYDEQRVREQAEELLEGTKVLEWLEQHATISFVSSKTGKRFAQ